MRYKTGARTRARRGAAGLVVLALVAAACGGDENAADDPTEEPADDPTEEPADDKTEEPADNPTEEPADDKTYGGTLIVGMTDAPGNDLLVDTNTAATRAMTNVNGRLIGFDMDGNVAPALAQDVTISDDGLTYTFELHQNARWHDGEQVTAQDIAFSLNEIELKSPFGGRLAGFIESVEATDDHTVVITLNQPYSPLLQSLAIVSFVPEHLFGRPEDGPNYYESALENPLILEPIGFGPFKFEEFVPGERVSMVRNDDYFLDEKPYLDRLVFVTIPDQNTLVSAFDAGEVDFLQTLVVPVDRIADYRQTEGVDVIDGGAGVGFVTYMEMNLENEILSNVDVRHALAHAVDRQAIVDLATFGAGTLAHSHLSSALPTHDPSYDVYEFDPGRAEQMLDDAGYPRGEDGTRFDLRVHVTSGIDADARTADLLRSQLGDVGIDVEVVTLDRAAFDAATATEGDFDIAIKLWTSGFDPGFVLMDNFLEKNFESGVFNRMSYSNPDIETLVPQAFAATNSDDLRAAYAPIQEILMKDLPSLPLYESPNVQVVSARFCDVVTDAVWGYFNQTREDAWECG